MVEIYWRKGKLIAVRQALVRVLWLIAHIDELKIEGESFRLVTTA